jgi:hypothetical protein
VSSSHAGELRQLCSDKFHHDFEKAISNPLEVDEHPLVASLARECSMDNESDVRDSSNIHAACSLSYRHESRDNRKVRQLEQHAFASAQNDEDDEGQTFVKRARYDSCPREQVCLAFYSC